MKAALIAVATLVSATAAHAQAPSLTALNAAVGKPVEIRPTLPQVAAEAHALKLAGIARTSVERRSDNATAALGFLCGIQDSAGRQGASAAFGADPHGRFLGAKLSFAFR
ncbi:hypothetical protein [Phenylobacterium sp.]|jgi:hypothetical protein|uniref:hypothetical protein n=1 Tax=Phenylobacterium sp. TaxID=1871053 RepID=UPI002F95001C